MMTPEEQQIRDWWYQEWDVLSAVYPRYGVPHQIQIDLSEEYKRRHVALIEQRKASEAQAARVQAFTEAHSERQCRDCGTPLEPHVGRGRPPVRCEEHRGLAD